MKSVTFPKKKQESTETPWIWMSKSDGDVEYSGSDNVLHYYLNYDLCYEDPDYARDRLYEILDETYNAMPDLYRNIIISDIKSILTDGWGYVVCFCDWNPAGMEHDANWCGNL